MPRRTSWTIEYKMKNGKIETSTFFTLQDLNNEKDWIRRELSKSDCPFVDCYVRHSMSDERRQVRNEPSYR